MTITHVPRLLDQRYYVFDLSSFCHRKKTLFNGYEQEALCDRKGKWGVGCILDGLPK
jgi:hypothetical protein